MPDQLQLRGGTTTEHNSFTGVTREVTVDTTKKTLVVHDGSTQGGVPLMRESGSNAASAVSIGTGGTNAINIDSSQKVGIGTASPAQILHLNKSSGDTYLRIQGGTNQGTLINKTDGTLVGGFVSGGAVGGSVNDIAMRVESGNNMLFAHGTSERMRIDSSGNVGIGGTAPNYQLHVVNGIGVGAHGFAQHLSIGNNSIQSLLLGTGYTNLSLNALGGNVGIGTTSPYTELDIATSVEDSTGTLAAHGIRLAHVGATDEEVIPITAGFKSQQDRARAGIGFISKISGSTEGYAGAVGFYTRSSADGSGLLRSDERMRIDPSGNLGIGTTSPDSKLHVSDDSAGAQLRLTRSNAAGNTNDYGRILWESQDDVLTGKIAVARESAENNGYMHFSTASGGTLSERMRIDSSGRLLVGTTTEGFGTADDLTIATSGDTGITIRSGTTNKGNIFFSDSTSGTDEFKGQVQYDHDIDALILHTNATPRMRIDSNGAVSVGSTANTYGGSILAANGYYVSAFNGDNLVTNSSQGGGSATLYIGNAAIQVSSDQRIKKDIVDTTLDATTKLKQVRVVDFKWNDPTDKAEVNRNSRGTWTGCLAQEMVNVFPYTVNAPRKDDNSIDTESERTWGLEYQHLVPALIKGFQEQQAEIETLKTKVAALEAA